MIKSVAKCKLLQYVTSLRLNEIIINQSACLKLVVPFYFDFNIFLNFFSKRFDIYDQYVTHSESDVRFERA